jgi:hypothetical protein
VPALLDRLARRRKSITWQISVLFQRLGSLAGRRSLGITSETVRTGVAINR